MATAFSRLLLAYDDSTVSNRALDYAMTLAAHGATLAIATAVSELAIVASATSAGGYAAIDPTPLIESLEEHGAMAVKTALEACAARGVVAHCAVLSDSPKNGLLDFANEHKSDLLIVGTHARSGISRAFLGSIAESILRSSKIPVLTINGHTAPPHAEAMFHRVLVALDDSVPAHAAVDVARRIAADFGSHLTLCCIVDARALDAQALTYGYDPDPIDRELRNEARAILTRAAANLGDGFSIDDLVVVDGEPATTIEHLAMQRNCDLIVLGSHGRTGLKRLFLGSVAESVVRSATIPVLVVPAPSLS